MNDDAYRRILAHVDDYLEVDPQTLEAPDRERYLADIRALLEVRVEADELDVEVQPHNGAGEAKAPESDAILAQSARGENTIPPPAPVAPFSTPREQRMLHWPEDGKRREFVHETLVKTGWNITETSPIVKIPRSSLSLIVNAIWPDHPQFANRRRTKAEVASALVENKCNRRLVARTLGIREETLCNLIKKYDLRAFEEQEKKEVC